MADGFSYEMSLIGIASLVMLMTDKEKRWPAATFLAAELLLIGTKFSNLTVFGILGLVLALYLIKILQKHRHLLSPLGLFFVAGILILWVPYGQNFLDRGSLLYPANLGWPKEVLVKTNIPLNMKGQNPLSLLFYGIYAKTQKAGSESDSRNIAELKPPFSTSFEEIDITNNYGGRVGSEGVLFSGLFTVSLAIYLIMLVNHKRLFPNLNILLAIHSP
jgi:hypothetical protein